MCAIQVAIVGSSLGWPIAVGRVVPIAIGGLFLLLGRLLPRFRSNFFFGIRTPWTLSSDAVWQRTHRAGGVVMVLIGASLVLAGAVGTERWLYVALGGGVAMMSVVLVYSYALWREEQAKKGG